tara:strand:+ start:1116 stop:1751 length:636 start_codon:yes stop_codon:yes gene_type:complete
MKILELFSGTGSIGKAFPNDEIISVDMNSDFNPTHLVSIFDFDYKQYDFFDYIHASPPCKWYSGLQQSHYNKFRVINGESVYYDRTVNEIMVEEESDVLVKKALEIIHYFNPKYWTMENPISNSPLSLVKRPFMSEYNYTTCSYCMYNYPIRKNTIFFNNFNLQLKDCDKTHIHRTLAMNRNGREICMTLYERYRIPHNLCLEIARQIKIN